MWFLTLILFIFILGIIVLVHEVGHFLWAKKFGVFIYEFSIGMGPVIFSKKGKDGIDYNIRALPIGGFVSMAGEVYEDDKKVPKEKCLCNKPIWQRVIVMLAGVTNNFILAIVFLFVIALFWGATVTTNKIAFIEDGSIFAENNIQAGDKIVAIDGKKVSSWEEMQTRLALKSKDGKHTFTIENEEKEVKDYKLKPEYIKDKDGNYIEEDGEKVERYGFAPEQRIEKGFVNAIKYTFKTFFNLIYTMLITLGNLVIGKLSLNNLSGPVGIYQVVGTAVTGLTLSAGIYNTIYIIALLSINVGLINIIPIPAFDGGRVLLLLIEKIKGSPINQKIENWFITISFILLMLLIVVVTFNDILRLF